MKPILAIFGAVVGTAGAAIFGVGAAIGLAILFQIASGNSFIPSRQSCMDAGGKWSEGIQYGRMTQLCTYN